MVAAQTGMPQGWLYNALEARLLSLVFPEIQAYTKRRQDPDNPTRWHFPLCQ
jgi:hypothetical protein